MSYTIMYGKQFIKTTRGIIPMALYGSNNCTEFVNGREVRERHWGVYANGQTEFHPQEYLKWLQGFCGGSYQEHFMQNSKWVDDAALIRWAKNGIKNAMTLEEIKEYNPWQTLNCRIYISYENRTSPIICQTTQELEAWLDSAYKQIEEIKAKSKDEPFVVLWFDGREKLNAPSKDKTPQGKVIALVRGRGYITYIKDNSYSYSNDASKAKVFDNVEQARIAFAELRFHFQGKVQFVDAKKKDECRDYCIMVQTKTCSSGLYLKTRVRGSLKLTTAIDGTMRFPTEKAAEKYIGKLQGRYLNIADYKVINLKETA